MNKLILVLMVGLFIISCNKQKKCLRSIVDDYTIEEYLVKYDSCKNDQDEIVKEYFNKKGELIFKGKGERSWKKGKWEYYREKKLQSVGYFNDGDPLEIYDFISKDTIEFINYNDSINEFIISYPRTWGYATEHPDYLLFAAKDSSDYHKAGFKISKLNYDGLSVEDIINGDPEEYLGKGYSDLKIKFIEAIPNVINIKLVYAWVNNNGRRLYNINAFYDLKDKKEIYVFSFFCDEEFKKDNFLIVDAIENSFKVYNPIIR
ncbi:hypothetical protein [Robertkochia solimangrovi]|uniref:hypothetical protein n=1 Tax=Robertkochia solimangrovi TaxID=2213046 RepID=UPI00117DFC1D|nr:hypothetical protein [Robertkochia solimangrovi]TRZ41656.1 hypothetical protein DMZ48_16745 [Robertkochia solimangrovi]